MTDKQENSVTEVADVKQEQQEREFTSFEKKMMAHGWNPDGELGAEDWIDHGFKVKSKKVDSLFAAVERLNNKLDKQNAVAFAEAKAALERERIEAIEMADVQRVKEIDAQIQNTTNLDPSVMEYQNAFMRKHAAWVFGSKEDLTASTIKAESEKLDKELALKGLSPEQHFMELEKGLFNKFPDYFKVESQPIANAVEGNQPKTVKPVTKKITFDDLDAYQKAAATNLAKQGVMTIEEYIKFASKLEKN